MHILIVSRTQIPVVTYGGTERVIWDLGRYLKLFPQYAEHLRTLPMHLFMQLRLSASTDESVTCVQLNFLVPKSCVRTILPNTMKLPRVRN